MLIRFYNAIWHLNVIFSHTHRCNGLVVPVEVDQLREVELGEQIPIHDNDFLGGYLRKEAQGTDCTEALIFMEVFDPYVPLVTVPEIVHDHRGLVIDREVELTETVRNEIVEDCFENGLVSDAQ